jgi:Holliday junction resolvasome RuvABC endonuclease subunit
MTAQYVWGVDVAISRVAFALAELDGDGLAVRTLVTRSDATEGERLGLLDRQLRVYVRQLHDAFPAAVVWVEQPSGRHRALQLTYCTGVIQAALFEALRVPVWTIPSSAWKVRALGAGRGNATKQQVAAWVDSLGYEPGSQDEADAIGIAVAGRAMLQSGTWKAAV